MTSNKRESRFEWTRLHELRVSVEAMTSDLHSGLFFRRLSTTKHDVTSNYKSGSHHRHHSKSLSTHPFALTYGATRWLVR